MEDGEQDKVKEGEDKKAEDDKSGEIEDKRKEPPPLEEANTTPLIDIANAAAERMENANKETARLQGIQAERDQRIALGGRSSSGVPDEKPKKLTDTEYAEALEKGEVNPLKEDGFI